MPAHEDAEQHAERHRRRADRELEQLEPDDFVNEGRAAGPDEQQQQRRKPALGHLEAGCGPRGLFSLVIVTAILSEERPWLTARRARRGRSGRRAARAPPLERLPGAVRRPRGSSTGPAPLTCASATACVVTPGCVWIRPEKNAGTPRRMPHVERDLTTTTCRRPSSMRASGATMAPLPYWRPLANATSSGRTSWRRPSTSMVRSSGLERERPREAPPARSPPCPVGRDRSRRTAAPRARPAPYRPR